MNALQAEEMVRLARERNLFLMEAMWTRTVPTVRRMQALLDEGAIGRVLAMQGNMAFFGNVQDTGHRLFNKELAGGSLLDVGVYVIAMASLVMNGRAPDSVQSAMAILKSTMVDEQCAMMLTWDGQEDADQDSGQDSGQVDKVIASLHCSVRSKLPRTFTVTGTHGYMQLSDPLNRPSQLTVCRVDDGATVASGGTGNARRRETVTVENFEEMQGLEKVGSGLHFQALHVAECLQKGLTESPLMPLDESVEIMRIMDTIRQQNSYTYPPHLETTDLPDDTAVMP